MPELVGIIPAAGEGRRLLPYGGAKELLPVGSQVANVDGEAVRTPKLVIEYVIEAMIEAGVRRLVIVTNPSKLSAISQHMASGRYKVDVAFIVRTSSSMAHSIDSAYTWVSGATVLMGMPDSVLAPTDCINQLVRFHSTNAADLSLGLFTTETPWRFGMIATDRHGIVTDHQDKPPHWNGRHMWGVAAWEPCFTDLLHEYLVGEPRVDREIVLGDAFDAMMVTAGRAVKAVEIVNGRYYDIGVYEDYRRAMVEL